MGSPLGPIMVNVFLSFYEVKLNFQRPTVSWKLFSGRFINAVMTAHASSVAEYSRVATRPGNPGCPGIVLEFFYVLENVLELKKMD